MEESVSDTDVLRVIHQGGRHAKMALIAWTSTVLQIIRLVERRYAAIVNKDADVPDRLEMDPVSFYTGP